MHYINQVSPQVARLQVLGRQAADQRQEAALAAAGREIFSEVRRTFAHVVFDAMASNLGSFLTWLELRVNVWTHQIYTPTRRHVASCCLQSSERRRQKG